MLSKKVLKDIESLGLKKNRDEQGLFIAEGPKIVSELLRVIPDKIEAVYATADWSDFFVAGSRLVEVSETELGRISQLKTPNQVLAVVRQWESRTPVGDGLLLYLDTIQDPGNFGTILRTADWFGVKQVVCSRGCADVYNPKVVQATMASIARVNVYYDESEDWLQEQAFPVFAAALNGRPLSAFEKTGNAVLVIGNESKGIRPEFLSLAKEKITIQKRGEAESLNAAVATGILLSHFLT